MSDYVQMWKDLGMDLENHDLLCQVLPTAVGDVFLSQENRPKAMDFWDLVISEVHGIRPAELIEAQKQGRKVFGTFCVYVPDEVVIAANGIVTGTDSTSFSPDAKVTREQLAAILYRYAQYRKLDTDASAKLNSFTDADSVSAYASEALGWAVSEGLINGASGKLMPKGDATRAQVAAILHRLVKNVLN